MIVYLKHTQPTNQHYPTPEISPKISTSTCALSELEGACKEPLVAVGAGVDGVGGELLPRSTSDLSEPLEGADCEASVGVPLAALVVVVAPAAAAVAAPFFRLVLGEPILLRWVLRRPSSVCFVST